MRADMSCTDCRELLDAYHDGELMPEELAAVRDHTAGCAECTEALESLTTMSRLLEEGLVRYSAPDVLKARIRSALSRDAALDEPEPRRSATVSRWTRMVAAGLGIAIASSAATVLVTSGRGATQPVAGDVLASHVRSLMPGHLVDVASTNQHNVKPWFNGRVDLSPTVPDLDSAAFPLVGGRLDYVAGRRVAAVVYGRRQHLINVYSWPEAGADRATSSTTVQGYHLMNWRVAGVESWVVSDLNASELADFAERYRRAASNAVR